MPSNLGNLIPIKKMSVLQVQLFFFFFFNFSLHMAGTSANKYYTFEYALKSFSVSEQRIKNCYLFLYCFQRLLLPWSHKSKPTSWSRCNYGKLRPAPPVRQKIKPCFNLINMMKKLVYIVSSGDPYIIQINFN